MVGRTLADIRERLGELSVAVGPYRVVSTRSGSGPVPIDGLQFPDRETAAEAATVAAAYRRALRRYDPHVTVHELIVTETAPARGGPADTHRSLPEYCHTIAGALFETLSDHHAPVERRVMDTYLAAAETTGDRERLCLTMLESTATTLDARLSTAEQATVLGAAAKRLPARPHTHVAGALETVQANGMLRTYSVEPTPTGPGHQAKRVTLLGYQPSLPDGRCPVLPVVVELFRHTGATPHLSDLRRTADGWELVVAPAGDALGGGLSVIGVDS